VRQAKVCGGQPGPKKPAPASGGTDAQEAEANRGAKQGASQGRGPEKPPGTGGHRGETDAGAVPAWGEAARRGRARPKKRERTAADASQRRSGRKGMGTVLPPAATGRRRSWAPLRGQGEAAVGVSAWPQASRFRVRCTSSSSGAGKARSPAARAAGDDPRGPAGSGWAAPATDSRQSRSTARSATNRNHRPAVAGASRQPHRAPAAGVRRQGAGGKEEQHPARGAQGMRGEAGGRAAASAAPMRRERPCVALGQVGRAGGRPGRWWTGSRSAARRLSRARTPQGGMRARQPGAPAARRPVGGNAACACAGGGEGRGGQPLGAGRLATPGGQGGGGVRWG